jgi:hypothetical protein
MTTRRSIKMVKQLELNIHTDEKIVNKKIKEGSAPPLDTQGTLSYTVTINKRIIAFQFTDFTTEFFWQPWHTYQGLELEFRLRPTSALNLTI